MDLSFIIPAYNASETISHCLDSILSFRRSKYSFEIIIIDDKSTDRTLSIIKEYSSRYDNIIIVEQPFNQRQGAARNRGIDIAHGDYIAFVDADDSIVAGGIINALKATKQSNTDICYYDFEFEMPRGVWTLFELPLEVKNQILSSQDYLNFYYTPYYNGAWRALYRSFFLRNTGIRFVEGVRWEDCDWTIKVYSRAKSIQFVEGIGYRYAFNERGTSRQTTPTAMAEKVYAGLRLMEFSNEIVSTTLSNLALRISEEGQYAYVINSIRLRNLSKYSVKDIICFYKELGKEKTNRLLKHSWPLWEFVFLRHRLFSIILLVFVCPIASIVRKYLNFIRK